MITRFLCKSHVCVCVCVNSPVLTFSAPGLLASFPHTHKKTISTGFLITRDPFRSCLWFPPPQSTHTRINTQRLPSCKTTEHLEQKYTHTHTKLQQRDWRNTKLNDDWRLRSLPRVRHVWCFSSSHSLSLTILLPEPLPALSACQTPHVSAPQTPVSACGLVALWLGR